MSSRRLPRGAPRVTRRRAAACVLAAGLATMSASTLARASTPRPTATDAEAVDSYVALGDSYTAGPLIPSQTGGLCFRSTENYPSLVAAALHVPQFTDASCSGATTDDMTQAQQNVGVDINQPQFDSLSSSTSLVTLGIGGNDIGFGSIILTCATESVTDPAGNPCQQHYTSGGTDQLVAAIDATSAKVAAALAGIRQRSPHAKVLLVGYPDILPQSGDGCWPILPVAAGDVTYLRGIEQKLNAMLAQRAAAAGDTYVDTYTSSIGHDACQPVSEQWVEAVIPNDPAFPVHPDAAGMRNDAGDVLATLGD